MAGLLEGLAKAVYSGFKGKLLKGTLRRSTATDVDDLGDPTDAAITTWPMQGFTEAYSDYFRAPAGIPLEDLKVNIFAASLPAGVRPRKDDTAALVFGSTTTWYQLRDATTDPATALWVCQAYVIPEPV